ncbi:hypothetical protein ACJMK2_004072 [Sinanodonta woodiana]|uniref:Uncharacterized protein n=1 Tax=Sinanodonta woodiana TaxID=1069815 RepID=A0ABD3Y1T4_SINWO
MAKAIVDSSSTHGHRCPICLNKFTSPRQLPCLHSFCEHCIQDYITEKGSSTDTIFEEFMCPVCKIVTKPANKGKPLSEWASLLPNSPFLFMGKSKVERSCEVCWSSSHSSRNVANKFCVVCEEFICDKCAVCHQNMRMTKSHEIITTETYTNNPENRIKFKEGFGCPEHDNEEIKFYCRSHETACCGTCSFLHHKSCPNVLELKQGLPGLMKAMNPQKIIEQLRKLKNHLKVVFDMNEKNIGVLGSRVESLCVEIGDIRKKLNALLDDIEKMVKLEGNRIYKEWLIRKQQQNNQCQSLLYAIKNSQALLETVVQYGTETKKFMVTNKTLKHLYLYSDQIRERFEKVDNVSIRIELDSNMQAMLSKDAIYFAKLVCQEKADDVYCTRLIVPLQKQCVILSRVIDVHSPFDKLPVYVGIVQLPDGHIILADWCNKSICLYNSSYNLVASHILLENPCSMCLIEDDEVAVTFSGQTFQFLSIKDGSIKNAGMATTKYKHCGVDAVTSKEIFVYGHCGDTWGSNKYYWSLITRNGDVTLHRECYCKPTQWVCAVLDMSKSRVFISVSGDNAVYCFGLRDGKQYFVYISRDLKVPRGISVDREDNVYIVGYHSNNIHKLSPDGVAVQVITSGVPEKPRGIYFNHNRDNFFVTTIKGLMSRKLHHFVHK